MKYIRTKNGRIIDLSINHTADEYKNIQMYYDNKYEIIAESDNIEELCDEFILVQIDDSKDIFVNYNGWLEHRGDNYYSFSLEQQKEHIKEMTGSLYGAIWIKGSKDEPILKPVTKMNNEGKLILL